MGGCDPEQKSGGSDCSFCRVNKNGEDLRKMKLAETWRVEKDILKYPESDEFIEGIHDL